MHFFSARGLHFGFVPKWGEPRMVSLPCRQTSKRIPSKTTRLASEAGCMPRQESTGAAAAVLCPKARGQGGGRDRRCPEVARFTGDCQAGMRPAACIFVSGCSDKCGQPVTPCLVVQLFSCWSPLEHSFHMTCPLLEWKLPESRSLGAELA